jgi:hypothetical protein
METTINKLNQIISELETWGKKKAILLSLITEDRIYDKEYINKLRDFIRTL